MNGHVFIVRCDITKLACDAWLAPCDRRAKPRGHFTPSFWKGPFKGEPFQSGERVQKLRDCPENCPQPWLVDVGGTKETSVQWYIEGVAKFLEDVKKDLANKKPLMGRTIPLVAMPVVGTAGGGALEKAGEIIEAMLKELSSFTANNPIDVALVAKNPDIYAAAQAERERNKQLGWPPELTTELREEADLLAERSRAGELALFIGAGVSMGAGLPGWKQLLQRLAAKAKMTPEEIKALDELNDVLDQATIIEGRFEGTGIKLGEAIQEEFAAHKHLSLSHAFLAALPVREVVTTNYDRLFEEAWELIDPDGVSIVPAKPRSHTRRWLLKMHGCVSEPARIVLTRSDYTRYDEHLPALAGIVKAFLVMRHMLFVGFSLTDSNFHRIVDSVRRLRNLGDKRDCFGTVLALKHGGLREVLWEKDLRRVRMVEDGKENTVSTPEAARRLEILLDYLLHRTRDTCHLLVGNRFDNVMTDGEKRIRDALAGFMQDLSPVEDSVRKTIAWRQIEQMLVSLGFDPKL